MPAVGLEPTRKRVVSRTVELFSKSRVQFCVHFVSFLEFRDRVRTHYPIDD